MTNPRGVVQGFVFLLFFLTLTKGQIINTKNGRVQGRSIAVLGKAVDEFLGIPYAKPPVGDRRFKYPEPAESWEPEVRSALQPTPSCFQSTAPFTLEPWRAVPDDLSEDCLHLNVWKPASSSGQLAVMVWIYGGGFTTGSIRIELYNGKYYAAEQNVIFVSINYRLGALGFSYLGPDTLPGNMGLMDQRMGLQWVKDNIANFGGDPSQVTLFGESAGSVSVGLHLLSPLSQDLFSRAILQSGTPNTPWGTITQERARQKLEKFSRLLKCPGNSDADIYGCFKDASPEILIQTQLLLSQDGVVFAPVTDGYFLEEHPDQMLKNKKSKKTEVIQGVTKDEANIFLYFSLGLVLNTTNVPADLELPPPVFQALLDFSLAKGITATNKPRSEFYSSFFNPEEGILQVDILNRFHTDWEFICPAVQFASYVSEMSPMYMYRFDHRSSKSPLPEWTGSPHSYELEFTLGTVLDDSLGYTVQEKALSRTVMTYWANFAKSGNPNTPTSLPNYWPVYDSNKSYLKLDVGSNLATGTRLRQHECNFLNKILPMIPSDGGSQPPTTPDFYCPVSSGSSVQVTMTTVGSTLLLLTNQYWL